jgi:hypothetical protein
LLTAVVGAGCFDDGNDLTTPPPAVDQVHIASVSASANPTNVLAANVAVVAEHADSARVLFAGAGAPDSTPGVSLTGVQASIPVLGLRNGVAYRGVVEAFGASGRVESDSVSFAGGELPEALHHVTFTTIGVGASGFSLGAVALGGTSVYVIAFDSAGAIRWYRGFDFPTAQATGDFKQQANGDFTLFLGTTTGSEPVPGHNVEFAPTGDLCGVGAASRQRQHGDRVRLRRPRHRGDARRECRVGGGHAGGWRADPGVSAHPDRFALSVPGSVSAPG